MKNSNPFGVGMPVAGNARALHVTARPAHASAAPAANGSVTAHATAVRAAIGAAAQRKRRTAAATHASVDGGFI